MEFLPTHYAYISGPNNYRQPVDWFDLEGVCIRERRQFIGMMLSEQGTPIAKMPEGFISSLQELERVINTYDILGE